MSIVTKESNPELYNALFEEDEIKEINIPENVLVALGDLTNGALNYYKATEAVKVRHNTILDYITNLRTIEQQYSAILSENAELENKITNLQQENEYLKKQNNEKTRIGVADHKYASKKEDEVIVLQEENERLKDDIYSTNQVVNELLDIKSRNKKAIEYLANCDWNCKDFENLYDILGGEDNEYY